jgi:hypothetical protein
MEVNEQRNRGLECRGMDGSRAQEGRIGQDGRVELRRFKNRRRSQNSVLIVR